MIPSLFRVTTAPSVIVLSNGARELSPFPRSPRELSPTHARLARLHSPSDAVVSRSYSQHCLSLLVAAAGASFRWLRHFAEQNVCQIQSLAAIDVLLERLQSLLVFLDSGRQLRQISRAHVLKLRFKTD